jgi:hypothetical protein
VLISTVGVPAKAAAFTTTAAEVALLAVELVALAVRE